MTSHKSIFQQEKINLFILNASILVFPDRLLLSTVNLEKFNFSTVKVPSCDSGYFQKIDYSCMATRYI